MNEETNQTICFSFVTEKCSHCGRENIIEWNVKDCGCYAFCPCCGGDLMICSECRIDQGICDFSSETSLCYRKVEWFWRCLDDVVFFENEHGELITEYDTNIIDAGKTIVSFPARTSREEIWQWFDKHHPKGAAYLLQGGASNGK